MDQLPRIESEHLKRQMKQTAAERYAEYLNDIVALVRLLDQELRAHRKKASRQPYEWGFTSDLGYVRRSLKNPLLFLTVSRFESRSEASRFIEEHLEAHSLERPGPLDSGFPADTKSRGVTRLRSRFGRPRARI